MTVLTACVLVLPVKGKGTFVTLKLLDKPETKFTFGLKFGDVNVFQIPI